MSNIRVELGFKDATINSVTMSNYNSVSSFVGGAYQNSVLAKNSREIAGFVVGSTPTGLGVYLSKYGGYMANCGSGNNEYIGNDGKSYGYRVDNGIEDGQFEIKIIGSGINKLKIKFDSQLGSYATVLYVNGELYVNSSYTFSLDFISEISSITVRIAAMSKPMTPIAIVNMAFSENFAYDKTNGLVSAEIYRQRSNDATSIEYGVISQSAEFTFVDTGNKIYVMILRGRNLGDIPTTIYLDDKIMGSYFTQAVWDYDIYTQRVTVQLSDELIKWQDVKLEMKYENKKKTLMQVVDYLIENSGGLEFEIESETRDFLEKVEIEFPYLDYDTLWEQWNKVATIGQFVVYLLTNGTVYVKRII